MASSERYPYVVRGARIYCTYGTHIRRLDMPVGHGAYIREIPMMHELDCEVGLDKNIAPFGACRSPASTNVDIIIEDAEDAMPIQDENGNNVMPPMPLEGKLCEPEPGDKWLDAQDDTLVDGVPAITVNCTIACRLDGIIGFMDDGQGV